MKVCSIIFAIVCLITVEGQNFHQRYTNTDVNENVNIKHVKKKPEESRRNQKQSFNNNNQNYLNEFQNIGVGDFLKDILFSTREIETQLKQGAIYRYPGYNDNRASYSNKCEDTLKELLILYKELASQLKYSHPAPPQIIYVPYPAPATFNYPVDKAPINVNITVNYTPKDTKSVGMDIPKKIGNEDDGDGSRPLSFKPKQASSRLKIPPPTFNHGSKQAGVRVTSTSNPISNRFIKRFGSIPQTPRYFK